MHMLPGDTNSGLISSKNKKFNFKFDKKQIRNLHCYEDIPLIIDLVVVALFRYSSGCLKYYFLTDFINS